MRSDIFHADAKNLPGILPERIIFDEYGEICGTADEITPELAIMLGRACAGIESRIAVGYSDCTMCKLLAGAFISGAAGSGAQITELGISFFAAAAYISRAYLFNLLVFFENDGQRLCIRLTDKFGLPLDASVRHRIQTNAKLNSASYAGISDVIMPKSISSSMDVFVSSLSKRGKLSGVNVAVTGTSLAAKTLREVLKGCGCEIVSSQRGTCELAVSADGTKLFIRDENEHWHDEGHTGALCALVHFLSGNRELAVAPDSPSAFEQIAAEFDAVILRIGRDSGAKEIYLTQNLFSSAISGAVTILTYVSDNNKTVSELLSSLPEFTLVSREIGLKKDRKVLLETLRKSCSDMYSEHFGSLRICTDAGWVSVHPTRSGSHLRITGEGMNEEIASELCNLFVEKADKLDRLSTK